uniref:1-phosphatidylinositol 3-phosphate 5-kinase isoform X2 n=1 Tax=Myxine glutinosa TaxID=7769 RepID=UPI0035901CC2
MATSNGSRDAIVEEDPLGKWKDSQSPLHLTSFKPLTPVVEELPLRSAYSSFVSLFRFGKGEGKDRAMSQCETRSVTRSIKDGESLSQPPRDSSSSPAREQASWVPHTADCGMHQPYEAVHQKEEPGMDPRVAGQLRSLGTVLRRLKEIMEGKNQDSDLKQYWMPDSQCKECYDCGERFTTFRRRHHCRLCGQIFCSRCCNQEISGKFMGYTGDLRVCNYCNRVAMSYTSSAEGGALGEELRLPAESSGGSPKLDLGNGERTSGISRRGSRGGFLEEELAWRGPARNESQVISHSSFAGLTAVPEEVVLSPSHASAVSPQGSRALFKVDAANEERRILLDSVQLKDLWRKIGHPNLGMEFRDHRFRLRNYPNSIVGKELVDWLISHDYVATRAQAQGIGQALVDGRWLDCITHHDEIFRDEYALYRPLQSLAPSEPSTPESLLENQEGPSEPTWFRNIKCEDSDSDGVDGAEPSIKLQRESGSPDIRSSISSFHSVESADSIASVSLSSDLDNVNFHVKKSSQFPHVPQHHTDQQGMILGPQREQQQNICISDEFIKESLYDRSVEKSNAELLLTPLGWQHTTLEGLRVENGERQTMERLLAANHWHMTVLLQQKFSAECLPMAWWEVVLTLLQQIVQMVRPDVRNDDDDMNIQHYVHFKKISGGKKFDSEVVNGFVCTKNVAHKKMSNYVKNPKILLLSCSIEYLYREETKLSSIDPIVLQEHEFLKNYVARIMELKPSVVLVEKTVSRIAQDLLLEQGITLATGVKRKVMEGVSRMTQGDLVQSLDQLVSKPRLGSCHKFHLQHFSVPSGQTKTLMFFEGCAQHLGCTVLLRGAGAYEMARVKEILLFMIFVAYHSRLEISLLMDEFAWPPSLSRRNSVHHPGRSRNSKPPPKRRTAMTHQEDELTPNLSRHGSDGIISAENVGLVQRSLNDEMGLQDSSGSSEGGTVGQSTCDKVDFKRPKVDPIGMEVFDSPATPLELKHPPEHNMDMNFQFLADKPYSMMTDTQIEDLFLDKDSTFMEYNGSPSIQTEDSASQRSTKNIGMDPEQIEGNTTKHPLSESHTSLSFDTDRFSVLPENREEVLTCISETFIKEFRDVVLCTSPFIVFPLPYLLTPAGILCPLRIYFPNEIYWSSLCHPEVKNAEDRGKKQQLRDTKAVTPHINGNVYPPKDAVVEVLPSHPLLSTMVTELVSASSDLARVLADYRARGGCLRIRHRPGLTTEDFTKVQSRAKPDCYPEQKIDCFNPMHHQRLCVLFSSYSIYSNNAPTPCVSPWLVTMEFYGRNDITLGMFLERYCFRPSYQCPSPCCDTPMVQHVRRFVHGDACLQILLKELESPVPGYQQTLLTWAWCRRCQQTTPVVPLSTDSWSISFAKYLELRFYGYQYTRRASVEPCTHSIQQDYHHYFSYNQTVASFSLSHVQLQEVILPPLTIRLELHCAPFLELLQDLKYFSMQVQQVYTAIDERLFSLKTDTFNKTREEKMEDLIAQKEIEETELWAWTEKQQMRITSAGPELSRHWMTISDTLLAQRQKLCELVASWNARLQELFLQEKGKKKQVVPPSPSRLRQADDRNNSQDAPSPRIGSSSNDGERGSSMSSIDLPYGALLEPPLQYEPPSYDVESEASIGADDGVDGALSGSIEGQVKEKSTMKAIIATFLPSSSYSPILLPFNPENHYLFEQERVPVVVCEKEPSSIIVFALSCREYKTAFDKMAWLTEKQCTEKDMNSLSTAEGKLKSNSPCHIGARATSGAPEPGTILGNRGMEPDQIAKKNPSGGGMLSFLRSSNPRTAEGVSGKRENQRGMDPNVFDTNSFAREAVDVQEDADSADKQKKEDVNPHIEIQFADSCARFFCRVYYAEDFRLLRECILGKSGEEAFIRSLAHCQPWQARGGKSGSAFYETQDERFILKQMSRLEVQSFVVFAPFYFDYITNAVKNKRPTALAKILGVYRIGFKNTQNNTEKKQDLLVMENLFFNCKMTQVFDLKGSLRNRHAKAELGKEPCELVLLDENLLGVARDKPLYIRPHGKAVLTAAILADAHFLASHLIIDYSLLVGLDEESGQLVLGIIDYIRTFTWDKKLEMVVKSSGILGGQGKMPTVVSPELYRARFCEAMDKYFLKVPDHWTGLGIGVDY